MPAPPNPLPAATRNWADDTARHLLDTFREDASTVDNSRHRCPDQRRTRLAAADHPGNYRRFSGGNIDGAIENFQTARPEPIKNLSNSINAIQTNKRGMPQVMKCMLWHPRFYGRERFRTSLFYCSVPASSFFRGVTEIPSSSSCFAATGEGSLGHQAGGIFYPWGRR